MQRAIALRRVTITRMPLTQTSLAPRGFRVVALAGAAIVAGCAQWGSAVLEDNHVAFNSAVADAMDRQMLLNIVRMSERRPTQWMTVSVINVQSTVGAGANGTVTIPSSGLVGGEAGGHLSFSYSPNITFVPQQGERLARELMASIPISTLEHLVSAGWSPEVVMLMCVGKFEHTSSFQVTYRHGIRLPNGDFGRMLQLMASLGDRGLLTLTQAPEEIVWNATPIPAEQIDVARIVQGSKDAGFFAPRPDGGYDYRTTELVPVLVLHPGIESAPEAADLERVMGVLPRAGSHRIVTSQEPGLEQHVAIRTRSFMATLQLLSAGVDPFPDAPGPQHDLDTLDELFAAMASVGEQFDLRQHMSALFRIHCSDRRPSDAVVSVHNGRHWYWIAPEDKSSRSAFAMIRDMYDLQVTATGQSPLLTLPVGAGR